MAAPQITAELLRRYVAGQASDAEQHAVERAALEDPFVADALEGFQTLPSPVPTDLSQKLSSRIASPRSLSVVYGRRIAVAASLVGVLATAYVLLTSIPQTPPAISVATQPSPTQPAAPADTAVEQPALALQATQAPTPSARKKIDVPPQVQQMSVDTTTRSSPLAVEAPMMATRMLREPLPAQVDSLAASSKEHSVALGSTKLDGTSRQPSLMMRRKKPAASVETGSVSRLKRSDTTGELELETEADYAARTRDSVVVTEVPTVPPQPQGGMEAVQAYLLEKSQQRLQGALLEISFRKNGSISRVRFLKNPGRVSRREVLLWLQQGPRWQAAFTAQGSVPFTLKLSL